MPHFIPTRVLDRYTAAPSPSTVTAVKSLHENIRSVLGDDYETFLQGSYKNDTSIRDLNDVDIVAVRRTVQSGVFQPPSAVGNTVNFETIFDDIRQRLEAHHAYQGKTGKRDKCINVATAFSADVVPAVKVGLDETKDPIAIYSCRQGQERLNYPRVHYKNAVEKHQRTRDRFKPTVRMFKYWAQAWFGDSDEAPSFYLESLVHCFTDESFLADPAERFVNLAATMVELPYGDGRVKTVAGDKQILVAGEWREASFRQFQRVLAYSLAQAQRSLAAHREADAITLWEQAFNS